MRVFAEVSMLEGWSGWMALFPSPGVLLTFFIGAAL